ncbi:MAG: hypothetical protein ABIB61_03520 [Candidatus Shapirobacteria bacterium]
MKKKEKRELDQSSISQLRGKLAKLEKDRLEAAMKKAQDKGKDVKKTTRLKKKIALVKSLVRQKELEGEK